MNFVDNVILWALTDHWAEQGYCPSIQEFHELTGIDRNSVLRALHSLEDGGYIERFQYVRGWKVVDASND